MSSEVPIFFATLDFSTGYCEEKMAENCKEKSTFVSRYETFKFKVILFGLMNALATFQRMMDEATRGFPLAMVCVDDVIILSWRLEEHMDHYRQFFERIQVVRLKKKVTICSFTQSQLKLPGHVASETGVRVDAEKVKDILEAPTPLNVTELSSFLGLAGYYRRVIRNLEESSAELHAAMSVKNPFQCNASIQAFLENLKEKLHKPLLLAFPYFDSSFFI